MSTWRFLVTVLLLIHPALSQAITSTCEIPSVEAGENTTLTIRFGLDFRKEGIRDFYLVHIGHSSTASQTRLLDCDFSYGNVTCKKTSCCTWERQVTDIFRVYIHNVSQELEGRFFGFVVPASTEYQKYCNFSLKAFSCPTDSIIATNSHMTCSNQSVTLCQTCTVTCNPGYHFKENIYSVTYTCVGKKKWFPENPLTSCEAYTCPTDYINALNSHMKCTTQPVTIGETCIVTCNHGYYFKVNQTSSVTYTCVEKNKWSTETPVTSCQEQGKGLETHTFIILILSIILCNVAIATIIILFMRQCVHLLQRKWKRRGNTEVCKSKIVIKESMSEERSSRDTEENSKELLRFRDSDFERRMNTERGSRIQFVYWGRGAGMRSISVPWSTSLLPNWSVTLDDSHYPTGS